MEIASLFLRNLYRIFSLYEIQLKNHLTIISSEIHKSLWSKPRNCNCPLWKVRKLSEAQELYITSQKTDQDRVLLPPALLTFLWDLAGAPGPVYMKPFVIISMEFLKAKKAVSFLSTHFGHSCLLSQVACCTQGHAVQKHRRNLGLVWPLECAYNTFWKAADRLCQLHQQALQKTRPKKDLKGEQFSLKRWYQARQ